MAACAEELVPLVTTPLIGAGLSLEVVPVLGRVVVATRPFSLGELVMCEQPLCVFDSNDDASYLRAYQSASETTRAKISTWSTLHSIKTKTHSWSSTELLRRGTTESRYTARVMLPAVELGTLAMPRS